LSAAQSAYAKVFNGALDPGNFDRRLAVLLEIFFKGLDEFVGNAIARSFDATASFRSSFFKHATILSAATKGFRRW